MIEQGQGPELPEEEEKGKESKPRRRNFLLSWLEARDGITSKESGEEKKYPRKGFSALLHRFFERDVSMEPVRESEKQERPETFDGVLDWWPVTRQQDEAEKSYETDEELSLPKAEMPEPTDQVDSKQPKPAAASETTEEIIDHSLPSSQELEEQVRQFRENDIAASDSEFVSASPKADAKKSKPEVLINNKEPLAAVTLLGLGAEYLGRKKQGSNQEKRTDNLKRKVETQDKRIGRQETELPRQLAETEANRLREALLAQRLPDSRREVKVAENRQEQPQKISERLPRREKLAEEVAKKVERYEKRHEAPAAVLKEMVRAAEVGAPVERIYERRQEVRDEPGGSYKYGSAVPVSSVLRNMSVTSHVTSSNTGHDKVATSPHQEGPLNSQQLYKQAAQRGFWGAMVIVIFALMVYLLR